ncbi:hypothetical protein Kpol_2000p63 [Vanderwaltozyma polyspora DSM 70294]|uniref:1-phosphatidylinositol 4-kinase n=1 Tax=Vanderwaltozyma polyspora (strain ATCC 22028 / DSM 70294 / BCRC 21397 / CBS 2163 / NBRC 10782 / NRRL Y-8283 / UCD 57-17) TaxID=436907 RepID=A7TF71_VANPO|nr:uncharacterized protein Kpol_2000p63 [Vanderwaltozyma polyspora DSM 70294]EDO19096.1 hypothetical protein Kpol_2000p63 [Vanderwaltozyma polyspora DSM 70294]
MTSTTNATPMVSNDGLVIQENQHILEFSNTSEFSVYDCIRLISSHSDNIGIHHFLCQKLLTFPHSELQFYIPQLVQILLTIETDSMALEDLLIKLRNENPHFALLTFWQLQALLTDLSSDPESYGFQVARRVLNEQQHALFNSSATDKDDDDEETNKRVKMNENLAPALMHSSMIFASMASPALAELTQPIIQSQGRRQKAYVFKLAKSAMKDFTKNINLKSSILNKKSKSARKVSSKRIESLSGPSSPRVDIVPPPTFEDQLFKKPKEVETNLNFDIVDNIGEQVFREKISNSIKLPKRRSKFIDESFLQKEFGNLSSSNPSEDKISKISTQKSCDLENYDDNSDIEDTIANYDNYVSSMPNLHEFERPSSLNGNNRLNALRKNGKNPNGLLLRTSSTSNLRSVSKVSEVPQEIDISKLSTKKKIKLLKANYFRYETQFAIALETISQRLSQVPTDARLSALRAELSLLNRDLPAEVDIPTLLPPNKKGKLHKLCTITASEAQVLNSAEKVPYLLLIEYLRNEFDFDPTSEENQEILKKKGNVSSFSFDLNIIGKGDLNEDTIILKPINDSQTNLAENRIVSEFSEYSTAGAQSDYGNVGQKEIDLSDISMIRVKNQTDAEAYRESLVLQSTSKVPKLPDNLENRNPELNFALNLDEVVVQGKDNKRGHNKYETDELADQMRISALMLAQLDKSPHELSDAANQIRAKIIASMKEGQDKFGYKDLEAIHGMAGERKLENDLMTGGIDTSYLGEDWATKKERIRKTSQFGHLENWDLCSVIAKTGDDLRQEAFATQIIQAMANIWTKEKVGVWVKRMKILITSANTGLVETITNAVSVHSIKKSLTKKMIDNGELDENGGIATLKDHYSRAFGDVNGFKFRRAQDNFACSLAAYSVICYLLQIKDRHNGNIMIDNEGHVCHIDFGFMLSNSPGSVGFESAPFKLTYEYADLLGGVEGEPYKKFVRLTKDSFKALRKYADQIVSMCEIMQKDNMQPCFNAGDQTSVQLRQRFHLELSDAECDDFVENFLVAKSLGSIYTRLYDQFQLITQGIYS